MAVTWPTMSPLVRIKNANALVLVSFMLSDRYSGISVSSLIFHSSVKSLE